MFRNKATTRLFRSASFGPQVRPENPGAPGSSGSSPRKSKHRSRSTSLGSDRESDREEPSDQSENRSSEVRAVQARLNHLEKFLSTMQTSLSATSDEVAQLVEIQSEVISESVAQYDATLEEMKAESVRVTRKLVDGLAQLERQKQVFQDLLKQTPEEQTFAAGDAIKLRVGEHLYHTSVTTMRRESDSMLAAMFSGKFKLSTDSDGCYFVDRDGKLFGIILSWLRMARVPSRSLSPEEVQELIEECIYFGLVRLEELLRARQRERLEVAEEDPESSERSAWMNIQSTATTAYVQSVIATLAEVTHYAFRCMAADAEQGHAATTLVFSPGQQFYDFFVQDNGQTKKTRQIFIELLRQEGAQCSLVPHATDIIIQCPLLRSDRVICQEVLRNFKKMRGFSRK